MLPQFGYIVAQAGADAHVPPVPPPSGLPPPQYSAASSAIANHQQQSPLQYRHEQLHTPPPPLDTRRPPSYYARQPSPPQHRHYHAAPPTSAMHPPPPPPPPAAAAATSSSTALPPLPYMSSATTTTAAAAVASAATASQIAHPPYSLHTSPFRPPPPNWRDDIVPVSHHQHPPTAPPPPQPPQPPATTGRPPAAAAASTVWHTPQPPLPAAYEYDPYHSQWDQEAPDVYQSKTIRMLRESNDLMTTMNSEFMEHSTVIYRNKLQLLQEELRSIQEGTHEVFMDELDDLETMREKTISDAQCMYEYLVSTIKQRYQTDIDAAEQDYEIERQSLQETVMAAIDDRRKLIRDDRDHGLDIKDLFRDAYHRIHHSRRNLRKRYHADRNQMGGSPSSRHENSRRRQARPSHPVGINGTTSQKEEDELDQEYAMMKGGST